MPTFTLWYVKHKLTSIPLNPHDKVWYHRRSHCILWTDWRNGLYAGVWIKIRWTLGLCHSFQMSAGLRMGCPWRGCICCGIKGTLPQFLKQPSLTYLGIRSKLRTGVTKSKEQWISSAKKQHNKKEWCYNKKIHKPHLVFLVREWNPGIYIHNKIWQTYGLCLSQRPQTLCAVERIQAILSVGL